MELSDPIILEETHTTYAQSPYRAQVEAKQGAHAMNKRAEPRATTFHGNAPIEIVDLESESVDMKVDDSVIQDVERGFRRVRLVMGNAEEGSEDAFPDALSDDTTGGTQSPASEPINGDRTALDKKRKSNSNKKKKVVQKKVVIPEEPEEPDSPQDILERHLRQRHYELEALQGLHSTFVHLHSLLDDPIAAPYPQAMSRIVSELLDEAISEIIEDAHFQLLTNPDDFALTSASSSTSSSIDIFGQDTASIRNNCFLCGNGCGRLISANRYAPHLEKCTGLNENKLSKPSRA